MIKSSLSSLDGRECLKHNPDFPRAPVVQDGTLHGLAPPCFEHNHPAPMAPVEQFRIQHRRPSPWRWHNPEDPLAPLMHFETLHSRFVCLCCFMCGKSKNDGLSKRCSSMERREKFEEEKSVTKGEQWWPPVAVRTWRKNCGRQEWYDRTRQWNDYR